MDSDATTIDLREAVPNQHRWVRGGSPVQHGSVCNAEWETRNCCIYTRNKYAWIGRARSYRRYGRGIGNLGRERDAGAGLAKRGGRSSIGERGPGEHYSCSSTALRGGVVAMHNYLDPTAQAIGGITSPARCCLRRHWRKPLLRLAAQSSIVAVVLIGEPLLAYALTYQPALKA